MKKIFLILLFILLFSNTAFSSKYRFDGYKWNKEDYRGKHNYIYGYIDGLTNASSVYFISILGHDKVLDPYTVYEDQTPNLIPTEKYLKHFGNQCSSQVGQYVDLWIRNVFLVSDLNQIIDGIDSFYSDYRNRKILVEDALRWVCNDLIGITPKDKMQKMLEFMRKNPKPELF